MKINNRDIEFLIEQLLNTSPEACSAYFRLGYYEYIEDFIGEIEILRFTLEKSQDPAA